MMEGINIVIFTKVAPLHLQIISPDYLSKEGSPYRVALTLWFMASTTRLVRHTMSLPHNHTSTFLCLANMIPGHLWPWHLICSQDVWPVNMGGKAITECV